MNLTRIRISVLFLVHALAVGSVLSRIPDLQRLNGLSDAELGLILMGQPLGALPFFLLSSPLIERFGPKRITLWLMPLLIGSTAFAGIVLNPVALFSAMVLHGATLSLTNVAINVEADRFEHATGKRIMNTCHGIWSVGFLATALLGVAMRGLGVTPAWHLGLFAPALIAFFLFSIVPLPVSIARPHAGAARHGLALPTLATLALVAFGLGAGLTEGVARAWGIIYMRDTFALPEWTQSLALPFLMGSMAIGRLLGDRMLDRFGQKTMARILATLALAGLLSIVFPPNGWFGLFGFVLIGFGISLLYPMMLSAAARLGDRPASQNVAAVTVVFQLVNLGAPVLVGLVAEAFGIQAAFALLIPLILLSLAMSGRIGLGDNRSAGKGPI